MNVNVSVQNALKGNPIHEHRVSRYIRQLSVRAKTERPKLHRLAI